MKIQWKYEGEAGFWTSAERRFEVSPVYYGRVNPVAYELRDNMHQWCAEARGFKPAVLKGFDTVAEAKAKAIKILATN